MSLVPYAGKDGDEGKRDFRKPARALMMFRSGKDTLEIAAHYGISEATALRWITVERCAVRGLRNPIRSKPCAA